MIARLFRLAFPPVLVLLACGLYRAGAHSGGLPPAIQPARTVPAKLLPRYDVAEVASDTQLALVLDRMRPPADPINTNHLVHALRLWGPRAEFSSPQIPSGRAMRDYLLDDSIFRRWAGADSPPLWTAHEGQIEARPWLADDPYRATAAVHADDLLATLAEIGVPLETPVHLRTGETTVSAILESALGRFHRQQWEYEWTLIVYARYVFPALSWRNAEGERLAVGDVIDELLEQPLRNGVCAGCHRLEALVLLDRANESSQVLRNRQVQQIRAHLKHVAGLLAASQHTEGYWTKRWPEGAAAVGNASAPLAERILATGHHLEWLAYAPPDVLPPRESIVRAAQWLIRAMLEVDYATIETEYGPFSHAARALCLWRQREPYDVWFAAHDSL